MNFYWWDDAVAVAVRRFRVTGKRQQVYRAGGLWWVTEAWAQMS